MAVAWVVPFLLICLDLVCLASSSPMSVLAIKLFIFLEWWRLMALEDWERPRQTVVSGLLRMEEGGLRSLVEEEDRLGCGRRRSMENLFVTFILLCLDRTPSKHSPT